MSPQKYQKCIDACLDCAVESKFSATACLNEKDLKMLSNCIRLDYGCSSICLLATDAMAGGSEFVKQICKLCVKICITCAVECEKFMNIEHCKKCAKACRKCARECSKICN